VIVTAQNKRASAYAACGRSGEPGPMGRWGLGTGSSSRSERNLGTEWYGSVRRPWSV